MSAIQSLTAFNAFENQLRTLCLQEFPCGIGKWKENYGKKRKDIEKDRVTSKFIITLKDYGANHDKTETLEELVTSKSSPWNLDYSWSNEAKELREIAVRSPWLIDDQFVRSHFKTLQIVDKDVAEVDESFRQFTQLEELSLSANRIRTVKSSNLPGSLKVLELCANEISDLTDLCLHPPANLNHLGLGYNSIALVDQYISGDYWPKLLSLDLSHNNLIDLMEIVHKLQTLPKLKNLILQGNPLALIPGYRGYTIDSLRRLSFLDDISISADEKHHFKGLAKRPVGKGPAKEFIVDQAKLIFHVSSIKGLPMPEEIKNPDEQPEFPVVTRKYYIQFMYLEDTVKFPVNEESTPDEEIRVTTPSIRETVSSSVNTSQKSGEAVSDAGIVMENDREKVQDKGRLHTLGVPTQTLLSVHHTGSQPATPDIDQDSLTKPAIKFVEINSAASEWAEDIELNWTKTIARDDLRAVRDFFELGMQISLVEEKVESFPAPESSSPPPSARSRDGKKDAKGDKKADKGKDKGKDDKAAKGGDKGKGKKKGEAEVEMVAMPTEFRTLCSFHIPLADFLDGEFVYENVFTYECTSSRDLFSPTSDVSSKHKERGKEKDKRKPSSAKKKDIKVEKEGRVKSGKKEEKKDKKEEKGKGKGELEEEAPASPPALEVHVRVKLDHWTTAMDSMRTEENSEPPAGAAEPPAP